MKIDITDIDLGPVLDKMAGAIVQPRHDENGTAVPPTADQLFRLKESLLPLISLALPSILEQVNKKVGSSIDDEVGSVVIPDDLGSLEP